MDVAIAFFKDKSYTSNAVRPSTIEFPPHSSTNICSEDNFITPNSGTEIDGRFSDLNFIDILDRRLLYLLI